MHITNLEAFTVAIPFRAPPLSAFGVSYPARVRTFIRVHTDAGLTGIGETATTFAIENTNLAAGQITIGLSESQTIALSPAIAYRWYMRWVDGGGVTRTVLSGTVTVANP